MTKARFLVITIITSLFLYACDSGKVADLEQKNAELEAQKNMQDSLLNDFLGTFNEIETNLDMITEKENLIAINSEGAEMRQDQKEKIVSDIQMINALLDQNRMMIDELTEKAEKSGLKADEYRRMVNRLKKKVSQQDSEINSLKEQLATLNFTIESLNGKIETLDMENQKLARLSEDQADQLTSQEDQIVSQSETIDAQQSELNAAFYVRGSKKELKDAEVLDGKYLNKQINENVFTRIDIREVVKIPLGVKKAELATPHPSDSYVMLDEDQDKVLDHIHITDPGNFWKTSRYLVVVTK